MPPNILILKNLTVVLSGQTIIKNLNLEVAQGDSLAIIGPNGAGKTIFLKALLGLIPHEGEIQWAPEAKVAYVPQKVEIDLHLPLTLQNLLEAKADIMKIPKQDIQSVAATVNLSSDILKSPIGHLSGGQFQKALITFALLGNPNVLLFDEPTASLDQLSEERIYELIYELQEKQKITVLLVSHDLNLLYRYATKVLCLNREKLCFGPPEDLKPEVLERVYGAPLKHFQHEHK
jgi:zinc transport system ATP-binding protein